MLNQEVAGWFKQVPGEDSGWDPRRFRIAIRWIGKDQCKLITALIDEPESIHLYNSCRRETTQCVQILADASDSLIGRIDKRAVLCATAQGFNTQTSCSCEQVKDLCVLQVQPGCQ